MKGVTVRRPLSNSWADRLSWKFSHIASALQFFRCLTLSQKIKKNKRMINFTTYKKEFHIFNDYLSPEAKTIMSCNPFYIIALYSLGNRPQHLIFAPSKCEALNILDGMELSVYDRYIFINVDHSERVNANGDLIGW